MASQRRQSGKRTAGSRKPTLSEKAMGKRTQEDEPSTESTLPLPRKKPRSIASDSSAPQQSTLTRLSTPSEISWKVTASSQSDYERSDPGEVDGLRFGSAESEGDPDVSDGGDSGDFNGDGKSEEGQELIKKRLGDATMKDYSVGDVLAVV